MEAVEITRPLEALEAFPVISKGAAHSRDVARELLARGCPLIKPHRYLSASIASLSIPLIEVAA
jgi:hypothetical protein